MCAVERPSRRVALSRLGSGLVKVANWAKVQPPGRSSRCSTALPNIALRRSRAGLQSSVRLWAVGAEIRDTPLPPATALRRKRFGRMGNVCGLGCLLKLRTALWEPQRFGPFLDFSVLHTRPLMAKIAQLGIRGYRWRTGGVESRRQLRGAPSRISRATARAVPCAHPKNFWTAATVALSRSPHSSAARTAATPVANVCPTRAL